ncbi:amino acid deaminase [Arthrobacter citreus]|jgi:D-serine deaminase-like pyridoxal phosphate-dependent protein|uniref:Amino acid deaminase n=1 Tax=Arthrobacter citreus TaxID=1670 RepID=A0ABZ2ZTL5_9MICC
MASSSAIDRDIDTDAVAALQNAVLDWRYKAAPVSASGETAGSFVAAHPTLASFSTPLLTLDRAAVHHNLDRLAHWCAERGVLLAPHGKTTMAPQLWAEQLQRGAWGITLANFAQLRVARAFGVRRLQLANSLTDPQAISWVAEETAAGRPVLSWVDAEETVERIGRVLSAAGSTAVLDVLVELGGHGGRTGARSVGAAQQVARAVARSPFLRLVGVSGYEGALAHTADPSGLAAVREYLGQMAVLHTALLEENLYGDGADVILTAGGSAYFDEVVDVLSPCVTGAETKGGPAVRLMIRSGAYLVHDDGFYRGISPFSRSGAAPLAAGMHGWARVVSLPEPGLAILDGGKRDFPVDEGLPEPQLIGAGLGEPMRPLKATITAVNDQHCFLAYDPALEIRMGDVVRLGLSHPCTALDKWTLIPVLADTDQDPTVVDLVHTFF